MKTSTPPPRDDTGDEGVIATVEFMYEIFAGNTKAKLELVLKAHDSVPIDTVENMTGIRQDHVDRLKNKKIIYEEDEKYKITPPLESQMEVLEELCERFDDQSPESRKGLLEFMYNTDYDADIREQYEIFEDSKIFTKNPMSKYSTLIQTASAVKSIRHTLSVPEEVQYRLHETQDLPPADAEFIYTHNAVEAVMSNEELEESAKKNDQCGVQYQFLEEGADTPNYNLTLVQIDEDLLDELRAPTDWLANMDLNGWMVVIETIAPWARSSQLFISDKNAVREWALNSETGVYRKYEKQAQPDSWTNPSGPLTKQVLV